MKRAKYLAETLKFEVDVLSAKTPKSVEAKLRIRERAALLKHILWAIKTITPLIKEQLLSHKKSSQQNRDNCFLIDSIWHIIEILRGIGQKEGL